MCCTEFIAFANFHLFLDEQYNNIIHTTFIQHLPFVVNNLYVEQISFNLYNIIILLIRLLA